MYNKIVFQMTIQTPIYRPTGRMFSMNGSFQIQAHNTCQ